MRQGLRFVLPLLALVVAAAMLAPGCEVNNAPSTGAGSSDTLTLSDSGPVTLDPALASTDTSLSYIVEVFSGLVSFDPQLDLTPDIAQSWDLSNDGRTYTFHLRPGVRFHDSREVTAADFKYSMERACDPATGSQTAELYLGDIVGAAEKLSGTALEISGVTVLDNYTLQITIDAPKQYFLSKLAHPAAFVVDRFNVEKGKEWWRQPNGTGPFRLKEWRDGELLVLERNDRYYLDPPHIEQVVYRLWGGVPMTLYETGQIDVTDVALSDIERVLDPANPLHSELTVTPRLSLYVIGFNSKRPPFDDPAVRQAFCQAVDKQKIVDLVLKNAVTKADGILPPGMPGYNENVRPLPFDPAQAKRLLAESRYGNATELPGVTLTSMGWGAVPNLEAALVDMWRRNLGVDVNVRQLEPERFADLIMREKDEMFTLGWQADYPDPQNFLDVLFHTGTSTNIGEYSNTELDALLERARVETDEATRMSLYKQAEQIIVSDAACLPLFFDVAYTLVKPYVKNLPLTPMWIPRLKYVYIQPH